MSNDEGPGHLEPLIAALVAAGNRVQEGRRYIGSFSVNQSGIYCALEDPINFEVAGSLALRPEVVFSEDIDCIGCSHCRALIYGSRHHEAVRRRNDLRRQASE